MAYIKLLSILFMAATGAGLSGCETIEGAGEDIENLGEAIDESAE